MRHFYNAPSVENNLYKSSFVKSGCNPITFKVLPFYWGAFSVTYFDSFLGGLDILLLPLVSRAIFFLYLLASRSSSRLSLLGPPTLRYRFYLSNFGLCLLLSSLRIGRRLSEGARLNLEVCLWFGVENWVNEKVTFFCDLWDFCFCLSFWIYSSRLTIGI